MKHRYPRNPEEFDKQFEKLVSDAKSDNGAKKVLENLVRDIIIEDMENNNGDTEQKIQYVTRQILDGYCTKNHSCEYEDSNISYAAISIPATRRQGTEYFTSGDTHFFKDFGMNHYVIGKMDGVGHGVTALVTILGARRILDELLRKEVHDPKQVAEKINENFNQIHGCVTLSCMHISVPDRKVHITNVGDGETYYYEQKSEEISRIKSYGYNIGMFSPDDELAKIEPYRKECKNFTKGDMIISLTDGITDRKNYDSNMIKKIIRQNRGDVKEMTKNIFIYANELSKGEDDSTIIGVYAR